MTTTNTRYVDPNAEAGGDGTTNALSGASCAYVSLAVWEAARQADLVAGDLIEKAVCSSDDAGSTHAEDTTAVTIDGWTTGVSNYIQIESASSHGGKWNTGIYRHVTTNPGGYGAINISEHFVRISGLQSSLTLSVNQSQFCIGWQTMPSLTGATPTLYFDKLILRCASATTGAPIGIGAIGTSGGWPTVYIKNSLFYDFIIGSSGVGVSNQSAGDVYVLNCTAYNCARAGYQNISGTTWYVNCGAASCTYGWYGYNSYYQINCSTSTPTFVDEANDDFRLASTDVTWKGAGWAIAGITDDYAGTARPSTHTCIGFHEETTAATEVLRYVDPDAEAGGDGTTNALTGTNCAYVSLSAAEAALQADLVTANTYVKIVCASHQDDAGETHTADTTAVTFDGWTTGPLNDIRIEGATYNNGIWDDTIYRIYIADICINFLEEFCYLTNLQMNPIGGAGDPIHAGVYYSPGVASYGRAFVDKCHIKPQSSSNYSIYGINHNQSYSTLNIINSIVEMSTTGTGSLTGVRSLSGSTTQRPVTNVFNSTIYGSRNGVASTWGIMTLYNTGIQSSAVGVSVGSGATITQINTVSTNLGVYVNAAAGNFALADTDRAFLRMGRDLSFLYTTDTLGTTRSKWDIGAFENTTATGTLTYTVYVDPNVTSTAIKRNGLSNALATEYDCAFISLADWQTWGYTTMQLNLTTKDIVMKVICSSNDAGSTHLADTAGVLITGWNTSATNYIEISSASNHYGKWTDNIYRRVAIGNNTNVGCGYVSWKGIQFDGHIIYWGGTGIDFGEILIDSCIFKADRGFWVFSDATAHGVIRNCLFYNQTVAAFSIGNNNFELQNCTFINCDIGISKGSGTVSATNCGFSNCATPINGTVTQTTCSTTTPTFLDAANKDFHLDPEDTTWRTGGTDLSAYFTTDIDGDTISGWGIGADWTPPALVRYVDPNSAGGDGTTSALSGANAAYVSLNAWEAATQQDLTSTNYVARVICNSADDHSPDITAVTIDGWTTDHAHYIDIRAGEDHGGKWNDGVYRISPAANQWSVLELAEDFVNVTGIQVLASLTTAIDRNGIGGNGLDSGTGIINLSKCIVKASITSTGTLLAFGFNQSYGSHTVNINNCIAYDCINSGSCGLLLTGSLAINVFNSTFYNCYYGIRCTSGRIIATNVGTASCTTAISGTITQTTCSSLTPVFVDEANDDFHLADTDTFWRRRGTNLSHLLGTDIDGATRSLWDIGADENTAAVDLETWNRYVDPNAAAGGDGSTNALSGAHAAYVSLSAWEAAEQNDLPTKNYIMKAICSSDDAGSTHLADTTACVVDGWTTDATRYIQIEAATAHGGKWSDAMYRMVFFGGYTALTVSEDFVNVLGLQFSVGHSNGFCYGVVVTDGAANSVVNLNRLIFVGTPSVIGGAFGVVHNGTSKNNRTVNLHNSLFYKFVGGTATAMGVSCVTYYHVTNVRNCTFVRCMYGVGKTYNSETVTVSNCGFTAVDTPFNGSGITQTTCSTDTPTFVDADNDDFHLAAGDTTWRGQGTDLSGTFTDDIDGEIRVNWDIGCDECLLSAGFLPFLFRPQYCPTFGGLTYG